MRLTVPTKRLILRPVELTDAPVMFSNWASDDEVTRYLMWPSHQSIETTEAIIRHWQDLYLDPKTLRFGIQLKETGELMGVIDVVRYVDDVPEIGYCLGKRFWNHGYMTEALSELLGILRSLGYPKAVICADVDNLASNRVIVKCGFVFTHASTVDAPLKNQYAIPVYWYEKIL